MLERGESHHRGELPAGVDPAAASGELAGWKQRLGAAGSTVELAASLMSRPFPPADAEVPPVPERAEVLLSSVGARQALITRLQAEQAADLLELSRCYPGLVEFLPTEVAVELGISDSSASWRIWAAKELIDDHTIPAVIAGGPCPTEDPPLDPDQLPDDLPPF